MNSSSRAIRQHNRRSWNAATRAHNRHKRDQARFLRDGGSTLFPEELELLGDLAGRSLVHLLCNSGQDTLSLARLGAEVTGVDLSDEAIAFARRLAAESGIAGTFERADVYDWLARAARAGRRFDLAFSSYGVFCWLTDLDTWARGVAAVLRPGGRFVAVDFHPAALVLDEAGRPAYPYSSGGRPLHNEQGIGDYVAAAGEGLAPSGFEAGEEPFTNPHPCYELAWGLGEIVEALLGAGLRLTALKEYPYANGWTPFSGMRPAPDRRFLVPEGFPDLPLMFAVAAEKPGR